VTFSYLTDVSRTLDQVRLAVGDTNSTDPQLQDEEIAFLLSQDPAPLEAAIAAADTIAARYTRQVDFEVNANLRMSLMQKQTSYQMLADRLRRKIARRGIVPYVGGVSISERCADAMDTDLVQPIFQRGMEQEPGTEPLTQTPQTGQPFPY
jgi:hypothetical protein